MEMSGFTNNEFLYCDSPFNIYNGIIENRRICIKKFYELFNFVGMKGIIREIVVATQMGVHRNALKLLGCCLETDFPALIYEFPEQGCLADRIYKGESSELGWEMRLSIGYQIAYVISYLQNGFRRPVIHRNLSAKDVFLDENYVAKVSGFYFSVLIPEGEEHVDDAIVGTTVYSAPEYIASGRLTEKTDVYLFGVLFLELLGGWIWNHNSIIESCKEGRIDEVVDLEILMEARENGKEHQVLQVLDLISGCLANKEDDRPNIVDVATALKKLLDSS